MSDFWTPEHVATLRTLIAEGLSSREIAKALGTTRGAVMGKAMRLGLRFKNSTKVAIPKPTPPIAPVTVSKNRTYTLRPNTPHLETSLHYRMWIHNQRIAGILHLVDMKRAGHSPTRTELDIPSDTSSLRRIRPELDVSAVGSLADWVMSA